MKIGFTLLFFTYFFCAPIFAQTAPNKYLVKLSNKECSQYSINQPEEFLSARAIERREKYNISINESDLPVCSQYIDSLKTLGLKVLNTSKWFNTVTIESTDTALIDTLNQLSFVQSVVAPQTKIYPVTEEYSNENTSGNILKTNSSTKYGDSWEQLNIHNGPYLHFTGNRGQNMHIAVLDAGFYHVDELVAFDSLWAKNRILGYKDFVKDGRNFFSTSSHGMKVLSIMAGNVPYTYIGSAPDASYWLLRTEDYYSEHIIEEDNWIAGAEFADSVGVDLISSSLGYSKFDYDTNSHSYENMDGNSTRISQAASFAVTKGIFVVTSAGNSGNQDWKYITAPADGIDVLAVGAVDVNGNYASFSSQGPSADGRIKPDVVAVGKSTIVQNNAGTFSPGNGTSFSAPLMAGLVACFMQSNPEKSPVEILEAIKKSSSQYYTPDHLLGYGIPDFFVADSIIKGENFERFPEDIDMIAYPNPFTDELNLEFINANKESFKLEIYNSSGKKVYKAKIEKSNSLVNILQVNDVQDLTPGIYIIKLYDRKQSNELKVIKL